MNEEGNGHKYVYSVSVQKGAISKKLTLFTNDKMELAEERTQIDAWAKTQDTSTVTIDEALDGVKVEHCRVHPSEVLQEAVSKKPPYKPYKFHYLADGATRCFGHA